jgi:hypothetical protein
MRPLELLVDCILGGGHDSTTQAGAVPAERLAAAWRPPKAQRGLKDFGIGAAAFPDPY